jgi:hypothetical protein
MFQIIFEPLFMYFKDKYSTRNLQETTDSDRSEPEETTDSDRSEPEVPKNTGYQDTPMPK